MADLIQPMTRQLLELFDGPLRDIRFPDADVERLRAIREATGPHWQIRIDANAGYDADTARVTAFHFMAIGQLLYTYPARRSRSVPKPNRVLHAAVAVGVATQVAAAWVPATSTLLGGAWLPAPLWLLVGATALVSWASAETLARAVWRAAR